LGAFLRGENSPNRATRARLTHWYFNVRDRAPGVSQEAVRAAISVITTYVSNTPSREFRERRLREVIDDLRKSTD
jgi:hypothetical protein